MSAISVDIESDVAVLSIDQPGSRVNVLSRVLWAELADALARIAARDDLSGLVLVSGKPGIFIAGADLNALVDVPSTDHVPTREFVEAGQRVLDRLTTLPFPTVACIDGPALGGGLEVALACDARIAGSHPKVALGLPEVGLGLIPGWGGTQRLPRLIGPASALDMILQGTSLDADRARERGLVDTIVPSENLRSTALKIAATLQVDSTRTRLQNALPIADRPATFAEITKGIATEAGLNAMSLSDDALQARRESLPAGPTRLAGLTAIDVIDRGCRLPLAQALQIEFEAFMRLAAGADARQLIGEFFARRTRKA